MPKVGFHRKRLMGWGSFWLYVILGSYRLDVYWEPINGWKHLRLPFKRQRALRIGPLLILGQNWREKMAK